MVDSLKKVREANPTNVDDIRNEVKYLVLEEESLRYDDGYGDAGGPASFSTLNYFKTLAFYDHAELQVYLDARVKDARVKDAQSSQFGPRRRYVVLETKKLEVKVTVTTTLSGGFSGAEPTDWAAPNPSFQPRD